MNRDVANVLARLAMVNTMRALKPARARQHTYVRVEKPEMTLADVKAIGEARAKRERRAAARQRQVAAGGFR